MLFKGSLDWKWKCRLLGMTEETLPRNASLANLSTSTLYTGMAHHHHHNDF